VTRVAGGPDGTALRAALPPRNDIMCIIGPSRHSCRHRSPSCPVTPRRRRVSPRRRAFIGGELQRFVGVVGVCAQRHGRVQGLLAAADGAVSRSCST
jgi:hypothetical protein